MDKFGYQVYNKSKEARNLRIQKWDFLKNIKIETILDIGANEGQFVAEILNIFPQAEVHSFEPLTDCFQKLESRFKGNKNVHTYNFALGEQTGEVTICRSLASPSSSILKMGSLHKKLFPHTAKLTEEKIKIKRLDNVLSMEKMKNYVLLKIDVQGAESKVITGAIEVLKNVDIIISEVSYAPLYEGQPLVKDIMALLESHNFIYIGNLEQFISPITNAPLFADAIFVNKEIYSILYKP